MKPLLIAIVAAVASAGSTSVAFAETVERDVVVYGGTPGGITAALAAAREGASVVLLEQTRHVGGLTTSGLNRDESNHMHRDETFGGLANRFILTAAERTGPGAKYSAYTWLPNIAEELFNEMLREAGVEVRFEQLLHSVELRDGRIASLAVRGNRTYRGKVFIDATYEGDLMAAAKVGFVTGRESADEFGESLGGVRYDKPVKASPYGADGELLPGILPGEPPKEGDASEHPMGYNVRLNLTTGPERVAITEPEDYDPARYELLARCIEAGEVRSLGEILGLYHMVGKRKECNNAQAGIVSMNMPEQHTPWVDATFEQREAIQRTYRSYSHGLLWFLQTDPRVPEDWRKTMGKFGLCGDQWADNGHWPWYLYVREGRRMRGAYVMTQADVTERRDKPDSIGLGSHWIDSHHATRYAVDKDTFVNEGRIWKSGKTFAIPYRALTPAADECANLLVPVCVSASHVAFCTIRLEPTWMQLGEAAGIAAALAAEDGAAVQSIDVPKLQARIKAAGIPVDLP